MIGWFLLWGGAVIGLGTSHCMFNQSCRNTQKALRDFIDECEKVERKYGYIDED